MTNNLKEKIYHGISLFCVVLCVWLIGQVAADELFGTSPQALVHRPPQIESVGQEPEPEGKQGFALEEERIGQELRRYLPDDLPLDGVEVEIGAGGSLMLKGSVHKQALLDYLAALELELPGGSMAAAFLPKELILSAAIHCTTDPESGLLALTPGQLKLGDMEVEPHILPQTFWDGLGQAVNKLLLAEEGAFSAITFSDGVVYLQ